MARHALGPTTIPLRASRNLSLLFFFALPILATSALGLLGSAGDSFSAFRQAPSLRPLQHADRFASPERLENLLTLRQDVVGPSFTTGPSEQNVDLVLTNGTAADQLYFLFVPEDGKTIEDYTISPFIGNTDLLSNDDVAILPVADDSSGSLLYNITVDFDFNKWTGETAFGLNAVDKATSATTSSSTAAFTVAGITFYTTDESGATAIYGGPNYPLTVNVVDINADRDVNLQVFVQYLDGTNSSTAMSVPVSGVDISVSDLDEEVVYDDAGCLADVGTYDGDDVTLASSCGLGFSSNNLDGAYVGPMFGFDFVANRNGSFTASYEWNELVAFTDLQSVGYETYIDVNVVGEVSPIVHKIYDDGPFGSSGTDVVTLILGNVPLNAASLDEWTYDLSITFPEGPRSATYQSNSAVINQNGTVSLAFTLPAGLGSNLPWSLSVNKPTGEQLSAIDETDPAYLFTFENRVIIETIEPVTGSERGGDEITIVGEFQNYDPSNSGVFFDGTQIDSALILSHSPTEIVFIAPSKADVDTDFVVDVTVQVDGTTSNSETFTYVPTTFIDTISPNYGPTDGGTLITLTGDFSGFDPSAAEDGIYFNGVLIEPSLISNHSEKAIVFTTPAKIFFGNDSTFEYIVTVKDGDDVSNGVTFTYEPEVIISTMSPTSGAEAGGTSVTLVGQFINFDTDTSSVYIGGKRLNNSAITSYSNETIVFTTPPRSDIGAGYSQNVWVTVGATKSNEKTFTFEDKSAGGTIVADGGSRNSATGNFELGICGNALFRAPISSGARSQNPTFQWALVDTDSGTDVLPIEGITSTAEVIYIPYETYKKQNVEFLLSVTVTTDYTTYTATETIIQREIQTIGIRIIDPDERSIASPNVTLTIPSEIGLPGCLNTELILNSTAISYVWVFRGTEYKFSYLNESTPEDEISPTLLGREFHIPQSLLEYGSFSLNLTAYFTEDPAILGSDSTTLVISPSPLVAQINNGESDQLVGESQDFSLSGLQSRDPDLLLGDQSEGLSYIWGCRHSWDQTFVEGDTDCATDLLQSPTDASFIVTASAIKNIQNATGTTYLQYSLKVSKTSTDAFDQAISRVSETVSSTLILTKEPTVVYEALSDIAITDNQTSLLDRSAIKYYQEVIIAPVSENANTTWSYRLVKPLSETRLLLANPDNLLPFAGYFAPGSEPAQDALGIIANVLTPNTEYRFLITSSSPGFAGNEQFLTLTTVERPIVTIGALPILSGDTNDTYVASAATSYAGDFKFYFIVTDQFGFESCVDGCQGLRIVRFRLGSPGIYSIRCDVYDSLGFTLLGSDEGRNNITVTSLTPTDSPLSVFTTEVNTALLAGDHASYQQLGTDMVKYVLSNNGSSDVDGDSDIFAAFAAGLNQISANAVPNAIQSANYVRTAAALVQLTPELGITYDTQTLYNLVNITVNAVLRTPNTAALQQLDDLLDFYDLTPELVLAVQSGGTTRRRLLQDSQDTEDVIGTIWLDLFEVMKEQISITVLKSCSCGCVAEVSTGTSSKARTSLNTRLSKVRQDSNETEALTEAAGYRNPTQGQLSLVQFKMGHICNSEQGKGLLLNEGAFGETRFSWCDAVFENTIKKLFFVLVRTPDYIWLSSLRQNTTLIDGLVSTMIGVVYGNNTIEDVTPEIDQCYSLSVPILRTLTTLPDDATDVTDHVPKGLRLAPQKAWGINNNKTKELYSPDFTGIDTTIGDASETEATNYTMVTLTMSRTGVLSVATRIAWGAAFQSLEGIFLSTAEIAGVTATVVLLVLMAAAGSWMIATRLLAPSGAALPVEPDFTYVERDVYGRGTALLMLDEQDGTMDL